MKTKLLYLFSVLCMLGVFTACSDDDKLEPIGTEFDGVYKGTLDVALDGTAVGSAIPQKIYITKVGENLIKMELKNFSFGVMQLGTIAVDQCDARKQSDTSCDFTGDQKLTLPVVGECDVTINGSIVGDKIDMNIAVKATQEGAAINVAVDFTGKKLASDQSSEAKITEFTFDHEGITQQPVINGKNITFIISEDMPSEDLATLVPTIKISDKATISPASGVAQDFSSPVTYTVTSEDGIFVSEYIVSLQGIQRIYSLDEWVELDAGNGTNPASKYFSPEPLNELASSAQGGAYLCAFGYTGGLPVVKTDDAYAGKAAAKLITLDTKGAAWGMAPALTSGSLFTGKFDLNMLDQLSSTKFGIMCDKKPLLFKGYYKYTPGELYIDASDKKNIVEHPELTDECSIKGILYEVANEDETLTGHDITNSNKIVATAILQDGSAQAEYTPFSLEFEFKDGKTYDSTKLYKLALICASSKDGDKFIGAAGSTLIVDELEVVFE